MAAGSSLSMAQNGGSNSLISPPQVDPFYTQGFVYLQWQSIAGLRGGQFRMYVDKACRDRQGCGEPWFQGFQ